MRKEKQQLRKIPQKKGDLRKKKTPRAADVTRLVTCTSPAGGFPVAVVCASNFRRGGRPALLQRTIGIPKTNCGLKKGDCRTGQGAR